MIPEGEKQNSMNIHNERMDRFTKAGLYLVTSESLSEGRTTIEIIQAALAGGVRLIQLREKNLPESEFLELAHKARDITQKAGALLIINDNLKIALAVKADGVHLGQDDTPIQEARQNAPDLIIGASSHNIEETVKAEKDGASYVNIGPVFATKTKEWTEEFLGLEGIRTISEYLSIPFTVMGGIKKEHIPELISAGARTIALVTAVTAADDPEQATRELLDLIKNIPVSG